MGTPPQAQTVIVDTGSHLLAFPCSDCNLKSRNCGHHLSNPYKIDDTLTIEDFKCD